MKIKGIRLYYLMAGSDEVRSNIAIGTEKITNCTIVRFKNGGWNPAGDCFLTKAQCLRFHNIPDKKEVNRYNKILKKVNEIKELMDN